MGSCSDLNKSVSSINSYLIWFIESNIIQREQYTEQSEQNTRSSTIYQRNTISRQLQESKM